MVADTDPESMVLSALIRAIRGKNFSVPSVASCKNQKLEDLNGVQNSATKRSQEGLRLTFLPAVVKAFFAGSAEYERILIRSWRSARIVK